MYSTSALPTTLKITNWIELSNAISTIKAGCLVVGSTVESSQPSNNHPYNMKVRKHIHVEFKDILNSTVFKINSHNFKAKHKLTPMYYF